MHEQDDHEKLTTLTNPPTAPALQSLRERFLRFIHGDTLMNLRLATKWWDAVVDALLADCVKIGVMIVHDGKDISSDVAEAREERRALAYEVILLLNITKVGDYACYFVKFLVVVDIPEGIESIGENAFRCCFDLTTVSLPTTLTLIC